MPYYFNNFSFDSELFELSMDNIQVHAEPQVLELLELLLKNANRTVTREEINEHVWRGRIVSEAALSSRIKSLRQLLHDDGKQQNVIRTIHKRGFRFVAPLISPENAPAEEKSNFIDDHAPHSTKLEKPTVLVLPFVNLSNDPDQEYFSDGVSADIITHLAKHRWLNVIARNTAFSFKGRSIDAKSIWDELAAHYIVEGTVQKLGARIRLDINLIDSQSGFQKWSERYNREISDIFTVQDEITEKVTARLEPEIGFAERNRVVLSRPDNLQAWDCYHLGVFHFFQFTSEANLQAQSLLKRSQKLDNNFGEAYAWWAYAVVFGMIYWDTDPSQQLLDEALAACEKALALDSQNASFYALRARVLLARREYGRAITENRRAIDLNPTFAPAHCGLGDSLAYEGRYEEALVCFRKSIALSPNDPQLWAFYTYGALALLFMQDYECALEWTDKALGIPNCQYWAHAHKAVALAHLNRLTEARASVTSLQKELPNFSCAYAKEKMFYLTRPEQISLYLTGLKLAGVTAR
jgi:adenylate cyclase